MAQSVVSFLVILILMVFNSPVNVEGQGQLSVQFSGMNMNMEFQLLLASQNWELIETYVASLRRISPPQRSLLTDEDKANLVRFYLYKDDLPVPREILFDDLNSLEESGFVREYPVKILIHGFAHNFHCSPLHTVKKAYFATGTQTNVIAVDWPALSRSLSTRVDPIKALLNYELAVEDAQIVGVRVGNFLTFLSRNDYVNADQVHIIGFSVGAHVAGVAAEQMSRNGLPKVGRITGLEPAGPLFATGLIGRHLRGEDAEFVDCVHTDMGQAGTTKIVGKVNFFVNGGRQPQPGCQQQNPLMTGSHEPGSLISNLITAACSHSAAVNYYAQSILWPNMVAKECVRQCVDVDCRDENEAGVIFGERCPTGAVGNFCLNLEPMEIFRAQQGCNSVAFLGIK